MNVQPFDGLLTNPSARMPVALALDVSGSMADYIDGERRIDRLNQGLSAFIGELKRDMSARFAAELSIFTFDGQCRCVAPFAPVNEFNEHACAVSIGRISGTNLGSAVDTAINAIDSRLNVYRQHGISWHKPWLVVISDGLSNRGDLNPPAMRAREREARGDLLVFPVTVCEEEAASQLATLSDIRRPLFSKQANF
ncbi:MAG: VWA domain-containing protein, partial [Planctomycetes bacterium]|nr:VWA domain-containing protein [Planctomycetota bacterium]